MLKTFERRKTNCESNFGKNRKNVMADHAATIVSMFLKVFFSLYFTSDPKTGKSTFLAIKGKKRQAINLFIRRGLKVSERLADN